MGDYQTLSDAVAEVVGLGAGRVLAVTQPGKQTPTCFPCWQQVVQVPVTMLEVVVIVQVQVHQVGSGS